MPPSLRSPLTRLRALAALLMLGSLGPSCAGAASTGAAEVDEVAAAPEPEPAPQGYVVVARTTRLYVEPSDDAPFVQHRSPQQQAFLEAKAQEAVAEEQRRLEEKERVRQERLEERRRTKWYKKRQRLRRKAERRRLRRMTAEQRREHRERERRRAREKAEGKAARLLKRQRRWAERDPRGHAERRVVVLQVVGEAPGWLEVETLTTEDAGRHCYRGALAGLEGARVRLWVRQDDVLPVTTGRVAVATGRGTSVTLLPGVALEAGQRALVDGFRLEIEVPAHAVDRVYEPTHELFEAPNTDTGFSNVAFAHGELKLSEEQALPFNPYYPLNVTGTRQIGRRFYATTQTRCGEYTVELEGQERLRTINERRVTRLSGGGRAVEEPYLEPDAELFWLDGSAAGRTMARYGLQREVEPRGARRCFAQRVYSMEPGDPDEVPRDDPGVLVLCAAKGDVVEPPSLEVF